ncbi:MAG: methyltransferase domain-containing protein [Deltaproteobacteria bacterium]|nr:methyltransferase domain-containing protein [Deltaproteobacteria bacterium]
MSEAPDLPRNDQLERQSERLAGMRSRLLRRLGIARCRRVLDLGSGPGIVTGELRRRAAGSVVALDRRRAPLALARPPAVVGDALALPFAAGTFDLVFAQHLFMWLPDPERALAEVARILAPGGRLLAIEPDFGAAIEHPPDTAVAPIAIAALRRAGADPMAGRRLATALGTAGWQVEVDLLPQLGPVERDRGVLLQGLILDRDERARLRAAQRRSARLPASAIVAHVPYFFMNAHR